LEFFYKLILCVITASEFRECENDQQFRNGRFVYNGRSVGSTAELSMYICDINEHWIGNGSCGKFSEEFHLCNINYSKPFQHGKPVYKMAK